MARRRRRKQVSAWEAMNQPVVEITDGAARMIFLVAAVILLMVWLMPSFGNGNLKVSVTSSNHVAEVFPPAGEAGRPPLAYQPLFGEYPYYEDYKVVAGASAVATSLPFGAFDEVVVAPFSEAAAQILDISQPIQEMVDYYHPGIAAVKDAWFELMADPQ